MSYFSDREFILIVQDLSILRGCLGYGGTTVGLVLLTCTGVANSDLALPASKVQESNHGSGITPCG